jgi:hypothetical protein
MTQISLRPLSPEPRPCKICSGESALFGHVDFNRSCEELRGFKLPPLGIPVHYRRCTGCGFLFTECFDDWTQAEFKQHIYNDDYVKVDPDYARNRPGVNASNIARQFYPERERIRILDYGGGNGRVAELLRSTGFAHVETYDPFTPQFCQRPQSKFDLITSYETFEHLPDPAPVFQEIADMLAPGGTVQFSTLLLPWSYDISWWYIGPRNGHVSIFSERALDIAWKKHGLSIRSSSSDLHVARRG